ncbi:ribosylnicotinamide kinase [Clydaea vesicula]|uniref:Ribosylnicotinamide kinase n=1 Tax=Clydaea vesicula TaxID=447962 RepID=A0AAD5U124_9FUNG|nr:ribosylnicotinamide kinase [Clydaea vesicula]
MTKSTLTGWLNKILPNSKILHQDQFFKKDSEIPIVNGIANWDCPEALDNENFLMTLKNCKKVGLKESVLNGNRPKLNSSEVDDMFINQLKKELLGSDSDLEFILIDGFLLYHDERFLKEFDISFFCLANKEVLIQRRQKRDAYITLEGFWEEPPKYFEEFVWPCYLKYNQKILKHLENKNAAAKDLEDNLKVKLLDSTETSIQNILEFAIRDIIHKVKQV